MRTYVLDKWIYANKSDLKEVEENPIPYSLYYMACTSVYIYRAIYILKADYSTVNEKSSKTDCFVFGTFQQPKKKRRL